MTLKPVSNHIIVKPFDNETVTSSGIILPDTVEKERSERGEIISIGPGKILDNGEREAMDVKVGQMVIFKKYSPDDVEVDGIKYLIITIDDVMAIIE